MFWSILYVIVGFIDLVDLSEVNVYLLNDYFIFYCFFYFDFDLCNFVFLYKIVELLCLFLYEINVCFV